MSHLTTLSDYVGKKEAPDSDTVLNKETPMDTVAAALTVREQEEYDVRTIFSGTARNYGHARHRVAKNRKIIRRNLGETTDYIGDTACFDDSGSWVRRRNMDDTDSVHDTGDDTDLEIEEVIDGYDHSGRTAYIEACNKTKVVPVSFYLRHMNDQELKLRHHQLGSNGVKPIAISLVSNATILSLDLTDNGIGFHGAQVLCDMLRENCFITHLNLSQNHLGTTSAEIISDIMSVTATLTHITLSNNMFDDRAAVYFSEAIMNTTKVEYLNLSHNKFSELAGMLFGPAITENASIKELDLSWNSLRRRGAVAIALGVKQNIMIRRLNVSWNGFGVDGCRELGKALIENTTLEELNVSNNRITTEAAVLLGKGLAVSESLTVLRMGKNPMQSAGCWAICSAILKNPNMVIRELHFEDILVNKDFEEMEKDVQNLIPEIKISHGGSDPPLKPKPRIHPMIKVQNFITKNNLKLIDFFQKFDADGSMSVNYEEFKQGLEDLGIHLLEEEIELLIYELDKDGDGEINYSVFTGKSRKTNPSTEAGERSEESSELVIGTQEFTEINKQLQAKAARAFTSTTAEAGSSVMRG